MPISFCVVGGVCGIHSQKNLTLVTVNEVLDIGVTLGAFFYDKMIMVQFCVLQWFQSRGHAHTAALQKPRVHAPNNIDDITAVYTCPTPYSRSPIGGRPTSYLTSVLMICIIIVNCAITEIT